MKMLNYNAGRGNLIELVLGHIKAGKLTEEEVNDIMRQAMQMANGAVLDFYGSMSHEANNFYEALKRSGLDE